MSWDGVSPLELGDAARLGKRMFGVWIRSKHPRVTEEEIAKALEHVPDDPQPLKQTGTEYDPWRRKFVALAWLKGASLAQLGKMFGISRQTILQQLDRELPMANRQTLRIAQPPMPPDELTKLHAEYYDVVKNYPDVIKEHDAMQLIGAVPLLAEIQKQKGPDTLDDAEPDAYTSGT